MIRGSAIHIAYRILAAFFIDMGAKTSIAESVLFIIVISHAIFLVEIRDRIFHEVNIIQQFVIECYLKIGVHHTLLTIQVQRDRCVALVNVECLPF